MQLNAAQCHWKSGLTVNSKLQWFRFTGWGVSTFLIWFWFFIVTWGACELVLDGMVTINVFFPFGELSSRLHPPKKTKKQIQIIILEKRGLYFELEREKTIRRYKNIYFNGHLWCKYHTNTTSIPTKSPSLSMKVHVLTNHKCLSKNRQERQCRIFMGH